MPLLTSTLTSLRTLLVAPTEVRMSTLLSGCYISGAEVGQYIQNFGRCIVQKTPPHRVAPLNQITSKGPLDLVCIDFLSLEPDSQGYGNVLVVTDHYTRYAQAFPAKQQNSCQDFN